MGYETIESFFAERGGSLEEAVELTGEWTEGAGTFRLAYVPSTGDVFAVRTADRAVAAFVGDVELLGEGIFDVETVESALWLDETTDPDSLYIRRENERATMLDWARQRLTVTGDPFVAPDPGAARPPGV